MSDKPYSIGVDLGGTNIKVGLVDKKHALKSKKSLPTAPDRPFSRVVADMAAAIQSMLAETGISAESCDGIGMGSPGIIDHMRGVVCFSANLNWKNVPLLAELQRYFRLPLQLSNDANCAVLGEVLAGAGRGCQHVVLLTLGTGVGGGVLSEGRLQEGGAPGGMELGHTLLVMDGELCTCGRRGCLEAYCSASALALFARRAAKLENSSLLHTLCGGDLTRMDGSIPFRAAAAGDSCAQRVVDYYIKCLGEGVINFVNLWRPEKVLIGGGISNEGDPLMLPLAGYVQSRYFGGKISLSPSLERAALGNDAGLIGAAALLQAVPRKGALV